MTPLIISCSFPLLDGNNRNESSLGSNVYICVFNGVWDENV